MRFISIVMLSAVAPVLHAITIPLEQGLYLLNTQTSAVADVTCTILASNVLDEQDYNTHSTM